MVNLAKLAKRKLGEILVEEGLLKDEQVQEALNRQKSAGGLFGENLIKLGFLTEEDIACALTKQFGLPYLDVSRYQIQKELLELLDPDVMLQNQFIILDKIGGTLLLAVSGIFNLKVFQELEQKTHSELFLFVSTASQVVGALRKHLKIQATTE